MIIQNTIEYKHIDRANNKPGLFCVEPNSPPVLGVVPNADVPKPPVVPKPVPAGTVYK